MSSVKITVQRQATFKTESKSGISAKFIIVAFHASAATKNGFGNLVIYQMQLQPVATKPNILLSNPTSSDPSGNWFKSDLENSFARAVSMLRKRLDASNFVEVTE